jgi:hypothetical protein
LANTPRSIGQNMIKCHFVTSNLTRRDRGLNPGNRAGKQATNHLQYSTATCVINGKDSAITEEIRRHEHFCSPFTAEEFQTTMSGSREINGTIQHCKSLKRDRVPCTSSLFFTVFCGLSLKHGMCKIELLFYSLIVKGFTSLHMPLSEEV